MADLLFARPDIEAHFKERLEPSCRDLAIELNAYAVNCGYAPMVVTGLYRSDQKSLDIYLPIALSVIQRGRSDLSSLTTSERKMFEDVRELSPEALRAWARGKPSWHKWMCAVDLSHSTYTLAHYAEFRSWLLLRCRPLGDWEVRTDNHGTGPHVHLARRNFAWRRKYTAGPAVGVA